MNQTLQTQSAPTTLLATFYVQDTLCGLDAATVQEVIRLGAVTRVRLGPEEVLGVINLRGRIVTLLDVGLLLGLGSAVPGRDSRIFIVEDRGEFLGLLVDRMGEVIEVDPGGGEPLPANLATSQAKVFQCIRRSAGRVIAVLNAAELLASGSWVAK